VGLVSLLLFAGCVAQKKKDAELKGLAKLYHNTTARFNGYFNATELYKASLEELTAQHRDDYTDLLPVYAYVDVENPKVVADKLDEAVKKVAVVVNLHRKSDYTDNCYLLAGKAHYLKQDYETAEETFRYLLDEYGKDYWRKKEQKKLRKKEKKQSGKKAKSSEKRMSRKERQKKQKKERKEREKARKEKKKKMEKWRKKYNRAVRKRRKGKDVPLPKRPGEAEEEMAQDSTLLDEAIAQQEEPEPQPEPEPEEEEQEEKDEDKKNYFLKHKPSYQEGTLWLARTLVERDREEEALRYIRELEGDPNLFAEVRRQIPPLRAYIFLKLDKTEPARQALEQAVELASNRQDKARYTYIMAQLYRRADQPDDAFAAFRQAKRYSNDYTMEFNSRLNMALNEWLAGRETQEDAVANLEQMLKEEKNAEFRDQIYFVMATIALEGNDREQAIANLVNSLRVSSANPNQRAEAYLTLADLYFEEEDYVMAKSYYDSTLQVMKPIAEDYQRVSRLSNNLKEIAAAIQTINLQDSLLRISRLSEEEKQELAFEIKAKEEQARLEAIKAQAGTSSRTGRPSSRKGAAGLQTATAFGQQAPNTPRPVTANLSGPESTFFAYDPKALRRGERDFQRKWGNRKLEDNWRRSSHSGASLFDDEEGVQEEPAASVFNEDEVAQILDDVPSGPEEVKLAEFELQQAMFSLGTLYRDRMKDNEKCVEALVELNRRFPGNNFELDSWYYLYLAHTDLGQALKAREYADKIQTKYSGSTYDRVIRNPNYANELLDEKAKLGRYYDQAFAAFKAGNYQKALQMCEGAKNEFGPKNELRAKFALLRAMNVGKLQGRDAYKLALKEVVAKYKDTPEQKQAREMLRILGGAVATLPGGDKVDLSRFKPEKDAIHYVLVAFEEEIDLNQVKIAVSDFNQAFFELKRLRIANIYLGKTAKDRLPIIVIRRFKNEAEAMDYYYTYQKNKDQFVDSSVPFKVLPITQNNYREVLRLKSATEYQAFFEQMYLE
jgi:hypothetical protein